MSNCLLLRGQPPYKTINSEVPLYSLFSFTHPQNEDMFERVAGLLREGEEGLLTIGATDPELRHVIDLASVSPRREHSGSGENSAADYD